MDGYRLDASYDLHGLGRLEVAQAACVVCHQAFDEDELRECEDCRLFNVCPDDYQEAACCAVACGSCWEPMSSCEHTRGPRLVQEAP